MCVLIGDAVARLQRVELAVVHGPPRCLVVAAEADEPGLACVPGPHERLYDLALLELVDTTRVYLDQIDEVGLEPLEAAVDGVGHRLDGPGSIGSVVHSVAGFGGEEVLAPSVRHRFADHLLGLSVACRRVEEVDALVQRSVEQFRRLFEVRLRIGVAVDLSEAEPQPRDLESGVAETASLHCVSSWGECVLRIAYSIRTAGERAR